MNSTVTPDSLRPEKDFRDYLFASRAIDTLKKLNQEPKFWMLGVGFKLPHLQLHVPYHYYKMYSQDASNRSPYLYDSWKLYEKELTFPRSVPSFHYRYPNEKSFTFIREDGKK